VPQGGLRAIRLRKPATSADSELQPSPYGTRGESILSTQAADHPGRDPPRILLAGWSTAFVFAVVNRMYEHWRQVHDAS